MKRVFALLLALMMCLSLAACGGGNDDKTPSGSNTPPSSGQQTQQPSNTPDADEPDDGGEDWTAGFNLPGLTAPEGSTAELRMYNDKCVTFEKSGGFTEAEVDAFAKQVWDSCMEVSPDGIYVGDETITLEECKGSDTYSWGYTNVAGNQMNVRIYFGEMDSGKLTFEIW